MLEIDKPLATERLLLFKGDWGDELVFAVLADEWRALGQGESAQGRARSNQRTSQ